MDSERCQKCPTLQGRQDAEDCMNNESSVMKNHVTLFELCLKSVLPICNGTVSKNDVNSTGFRI